MKTNSLRPLAKGQVWKTRAADIEIVALGKRLIHYRITRQLAEKGSAPNSAASGEEANGRSSLWRAQCPQRLVNGRFATGRSST